ncbi:MAG TPA: TadE/TadG family protein [Bryobacteraceae bacterium]|nr:TadE/TadG family protein [Bryobacteraceae bacterium]
MTRTVSSRRRNERGVVTLLYTLMMLFIIIPMAGLAIDAGIVYTIKTKLQAAVDGASLAAARSLNLNTSVTQQSGPATTFATSVLHANFPTGWMSVATVPDPTVTIATHTQDTSIPLGEVQISVSETIQAPTWFMRILGFNSVSMTASGVAVRRNVNVMLVIDRSQSLQDEGNCGTLKTDAQAFVNSFVEGQDKLGMVTFGTSYHYDFAFNTTFKSTMTTDLSNLVCSGFTNAAAGFSYGFNQLVGLGDQNALNVIVFFTDGEPNTMTFGVNPSTGAATSTANSPLPYKSGSACVPANTNLSGVIAGDASTHYNAWGGVFNWTNSGIPVSSDFNPNTSFTGCAYRSSSLGSGNSASFSSDIASLPATDAFGNATNSTWAGGTNGSFPYSVTLNGNWYYLQNLENAGINTLDNAAQNARVAAAAAGIPYVVYTIGLNPNIYGSVNQELLRRVANDPASAVYQSTYAAGTFYYVPSATQLNQAFSDIASDILRLAK